jgi:hypothetical protein
MKLLARMDVSGVFYLCLVLVLLGGISCSCAQQMDQMGHMDQAKPTVPSTQLTVRGIDGKSITFTPADLAVLPHKTIAVYNEHTKANEKYSGVTLSELLKKVGTPSGEDVRGKLFMTAVVAEGTDHYSVLYSLAEVDPSIHTGDVIVADAVDGHPLDKDGAFKMVSTEERRPARWVRNLTQISVIDVKP